MGKMTGKFGENLKFESRTGRNSDLAVEKLLTDQFE